MNKKLIAALFAGVFAFASVSTMAQEKTPPIPVDTAKLKAERDAAKAKWNSMSADQKAATRKAMRDKKVSELTMVEMVAQENDSGSSGVGAMPASDAAKYKSDYDAAKSKWAGMTADQKAATRKAARDKKVSELSMLERMSIGAE
jgi:cell division protein FtsL